MKIEPPIDSAAEAEEDVVLQCDEPEAARGDVHVRECRCKYSTLIYFPLIFLLCVFLTC